MLNIAAKLSKFGVYASTQALSCRTVVVQVQGWVMFFHTQKNEMKQVYEIF